MFVCARNRCLNILNSILRRFAGDLAVPVLAVAIERLPQSAESRVSEKVLK